MWHRVGGEQFGVFRNVHNVFHVGQQRRIEAPERFSAQTANAARRLSDVRSESLGVDDTVAGAGEERGYRFEVLAVSLRSVR